MFLNVTKTNFMLFSKLNNNVDVNVSLCGLNVTRVYVTKFLGVLIDSKLSWKEHIKCISIKLSKCCSILYKASYLLDTATLRTLYNAMFLKIETVIHINRVFLLFFCYFHVPNCYISIIMFVLLIHL